MSWSVDIDKSLNTARFSDAALFCSTKEEQTNRAIAMQESSGSRRLVRRLVQFATTLQSFAAQTKQQQVAIVPNMMSDSATVG
jgi:hypothetical protein